MKRQDLSLIQIVGDIEYVNIPNRQIPQRKSKAYERINVNDTSINEDLLFITCNGKHQLHQKLQVLQSEDYYIDCRVHAATAMEELFSFEFDQGVSIDGIDLDNTMVDCLQLIGEPCKDGNICATA